jgi:hypothetical protein
MPKYSEPVLKVACLALGLLLVFQVVSFARRLNPLGGVRVPVPSAGTRLVATRPDKPGATAPGTPATIQTNLPPEVQARIERIADSEILGPVPKPVQVPVTLLGIEGKDVFLRTPSGQTGLLRLGEELGGIKLLQVGTNRVLVEEDGQKKELTMFSGFGSQPLLPQAKENLQ